jgi:hypothetical protein
MGRALAGGNLGATTTSTPDDVDTGGTLRMNASSNQALRAAREAVVRAHVEAETIQHSVTATIATFRHPRYEIPAFGVVADGAEAVENLLNGFLRAFPDL